MDDKRFDFEEYEFFFFFKPIKYRRKCFAMHNVQIESKKYNLNVKFTTSHNLEIIEIIT